MEILSSNFDQTFEQIEKAIHEADFVCWDCEYPGGTVSEDDVGSPYDTIEERY
jgi:hypothetical protein